MVGFSAGETSGEDLLLLALDRADGEAADWEFPVIVAVVEIGFGPSVDGVIPFPNDNRNGEFCFDDAESPSLKSGRGAAKDDCE